MSPSKLRDRNSGGIQYFDVFAERMKQPLGTASRPPVSQEALEAARKSLGRRGYEERLEPNLFQVKAGGEYPEPPHPRLPRL